MTVVFGTIYHTLEIAGPANSRRAAHVRRSGRLRATSTKKRATMPAH